MSVRKRGRYWHYQFEVKGTRYFGRLPTAKTKREALDLESQERIKVYTGTYGKEPELEDFAKFVDKSFMPYSKENKSSWAHDEFRSEMLKEWFKGKKFQDITPMLVEKFIKDRLASSTVRKQEFPDGSKMHRKRSPCTVNKEFVLLSSIFNMAINEKVTTENPCSHIRKTVRKKIQPRAKRKRFLTWEEEPRLVEALSGRREHLKPLITIAIETGLRRSELLKLRCEQVNLGSIPLYFTIGEDEWEVKPYHLLVIKSKNGKPRVVPISPKAVNVFSSLMNDETTGEYVFTSFRTGGGLTEIKKGFVSACRAAGIPHGVNTPNGLIFHDLRRTFATRLAEKGVHPVVIQELLGHSHMHMTEIYMRATPESMWQAVNTPNPQIAQHESNHGRITAMR